MPAQVQLLAGPACCGKTKQLLDEYRRRLKRTNAQTLGNCYWLAPNQAALSQLQDSLLVGAETALLQPNLFTFASFAESFIARSHRRIRSITQPQKRRLLQHVIQTMLEQRQFEHFAQVATTSGFVTQVSEFISELKRTDVWPEDYERWCSQGPRSDHRVRELSRIYTAYQQQLHRGELYDAEGRFWAAREILAESTTEYRFDLVVVNGFNDFTAAQYDILRLLNEYSSELRISLTLEKTAPETSDDNNSSLLFAKTSQTFARLQAALPQLEVEYLASSAPQGGTLSYLQNQLFREPDILKAEGGRQKAEREGKRQIESVEIIAANSELGEIEAIAERIKDLLQSQQAQPQDIVVVCRTGEDSAAMISAVFSDYGIPYASELRPRLEAEPLVRALLPLLRLYQEDWPFQTLLEVVNNRQFTRFDEGNEASTSFATQPRIALEHCLRTAQLPAGKVALLEQLEYRLNAAAQAERGEIDQCGVQVSVALDKLRLLDELLSALPTEASIGDWVDALEVLLARLGALRQQSELRSRATMAWELMSRGLRENESVDAWILPDKQLVSLPELQELIVSVARDQRLAASHDAVGRVRILSAESARKLSTKHLFLAGLSEQAFSSAITGDQPVATDVAQALATNLPSPPNERVELDVHRGDGMLLFYELATRPTESLTLSYSALDAKGQPLPPSPLLTDLERSVGAGRIPRSTMGLSQVAVRDTAPYSLANFRQQAVDQALAGKQHWLAGMISHPNLVRAGSSILDGIDCVAMRSVRDSYGSYEGLLLSESAQAALARRFDDQHLWSPSQLESYAACPFRFFSEQLLSLEPLNELAVSNDPRRRGSLLHHVLATIHEQLRAAVAESTELNNDDLVERFLATLDATVKAAPLRGIEHSLREIERREIEAWAPSYAQQEVSYRKQWKHLDEPPRPAHFEVRFGPETRIRTGDTADRASTPVPFELDLGDQRIRLTGQIDRVDIGRVGGVTVFNIIDYKSGKEVKLNLDKVSSGHQLQLPLYALAVEQLLLADQQAVALATGYWNIQGKGFGTSRSGPLQLRELADQTLKTSANWQNLQPKILSRVQQLISGIRDGQFPVYNEDEHCTRSCSLSTICRVAQIRSLEKVWPPELLPENESSGGGDLGK